MELTYFQRLQLVDITINRLESVFQFWLSATFAAIVASHLASDRLTKAYASMLTGLYSVFTFSVVVRMMAFRETLGRYFLQLAEIREDSLGSSVADLVNGSIWAPVTRRHVSDGTLQTASREKQEAPSKWACRQVFSVNISFLRTEVSYSQ